MSTKPQYPRMLYRNGDRDQESIVVEDAAAEKAAVADGYAIAGPLEEPKSAKKAK